MVVKDIEPWDQIFFSTRDKICIPGKIDEITTKLNQLKEKAKNAADDAISKLNEAAGISAKVSRLPRQDILDNYRQALVAQVYKLTDEATIISRSSQSIVQTIQETVLATESEQDSLGKTSLNVIKIAENANVQAQLALKIGQGLKQLLKNFDQPEGGLIFFIKLIKYYTEL